MRFNRILWIDLTGKDVTFLPESFHLIINSIESTRPRYPTPVTDPGSWWWLERLVSAISGLHRQTGISYDRAGEGWPHGTKWLDQAKTHPGMSGAPAKTSSAKPLIA